MVGDVAPSALDDSVPASSFPLHSSTCWGYSNNQNEQCTHIDGPVITCVEDAGGTGLGRVWYGFSWSFHSRSTCKSSSNSSHWPSCFLSSFEGTVLYFDWSLFVCSPELVRSVMTDVRDSSEDFVVLAPLTLLTERDSALWELFVLAWTALESSLLSESSQAKLEFWKCMSYDIIFIKTAIKACNYLKLNSIGYHSSLVFWRRIVIARKSLVIFLLQLNSWMEAPVKFQNSLKY